MLNEKVLTNQGIKTNQAQEGNVETDQRTHAFISNTEILVSANPADLPNNTQARITFVLASDKCR